MRWGRRFFYHKGHEGHEGEYIAFGKHDIQQEGCIVDRIPVVIPLQTEAVGRQVIDAAIQVHKGLGPGLLENAYEECLMYELVQRGMRVKRQLVLPVEYKGVSIEAGYRIDLVVNDLVIVELKVVDALLPVHEAQLLTYLKLGGYRLGYLMNFNVTLMKDGIKRRVQ